MSLTRIGKVAPSWVSLPTTSRWVENVKLCVKIQPSNVVLAPSSTDGQMPFCSDAVDGNEDDATESAQDDSEDTCSHGEDTCSQEAEAGAEEEARWAMGKQIPRLLHEG